MKKLLYLLFSFMVALSSCDDSLDEVYEELDNSPNSRREVAITLSVANYESLKGKEGVPSYVNTNHYFASEEEAGKLIPIFLNASYGHLANNDVIEVTYNTASPSAVSERVSYTLTTQEDYNLGGVTNNRTQFENMSQIETSLNAKFGPAKEGRLATITYTWYNSNVGDGNGAVVTRTSPNSFYFTGGKWYSTTALTAKEYVAVDRSRNNAFAVGDDVALIPATLNKFFKENIVGAKVGDVQYGSYLVRYSSSSTLQEVMPLFFDGNNWVKTMPATLGFIKKNGVWVADPIVKYTLTSADYTYISELPNVGTAGSRANLASFKNFYQRFTDNANYWPQAEIVKGIGAVLDFRFPDAAEGQKYEVTYTVHTGPTGPATVVMQKVDGKFVLAVD